MINSQECLYSAKVGFLFLSVGMSTETASEGVVKLYANPQGQMSSRITSTDYVGDVS